jgi:Fic family protein
MSQLQKLLLEVDAAKRELDTLRPLPIEIQKKVEQKLRIEWTYHSNAIEGNTLTLSETRSLIISGLHIGNKQGRHYEEIKLHNEVVLALEEIVYTKTDITLAFIRDLHAQLMGPEYTVQSFDSLGNEVNKKGRPGQWKDSPNFVRRGDSEPRYFTSVESTPAEMADLVDWLREETAKAELHPVVISAIFHIRFVTIHPFDDGNGRMARILMNLLLMRAGYTWAIIKAEDRETRYFPALVLAQDSNDVQPFCELISPPLKTQRPKPCNVQVGRI